MCRLSMNRLHSIGGTIELYKNIVSTHFLNFLDELFLVRIPQLSTIIKYKIHKYLNLHFSLKIKY
jgi:hypothetical protein